MHPSLHATCCIHSRRRFDDATVESVPPTAPEHVRISAIAARTPRTTRRDKGIAGRISEAWPLASPASCFSDTFARHHSLYPIILRSLRSKRLEG